MATTDPRRGSAPLIALLLLVAGGARGAEEDPQEAQRQASDEPQLLKVYVDAMITEGFVDAIIADVRLWIEKRPKIQFVVFQLETPGGEVEATRRLANFIYSELKGYRTIAFIPPGRYAFSGGTLLAVAANEIVMGEDSHMGAAAPVLGDDPTQELGEKVQSVIRSLFATYAQDRGYPTILTDAMVTKASDDILQVRFRDPDETRFMTRRQAERDIANEQRLRRVGEPRVILQQGRLLTIDEKDARDFGFVKHIAGNLTELRAELMLPIGNENVVDSRIGQLKSRYPAGQAVIDFFNRPVARFLLLLAGSLAILIELKTFGLIVPGAVGFACFAIFFITSLLPVTGSVEGTASLPEALLFVVGIGLVGVEFFLLPGTAVFAVSGAAVCLVALVLAMVPGEGTLHSTFTIQDAITILAYGFGTGTVCFLLVLRFLPHNPVFARRGLVSNTAIVGVPTADSALTAQSVAQELLGKTGIAVTTLRPAGKMETDDGQLLDVMAEGEFVEQGTKVRIFQCQDGQILVARLDGR